MMIAILFPEYMMYCALLLFLAAWILREEVNQYLEHPANEFH